MSLFSIAPAMADRPTLPNCAVASLLLTLMTGCSTNAPRNAEDASAAPARLASDISLKHPSFSRSAVIYQINTRQFTAEGTFTAAAAELPRLKSLGADILWLMPIHPIGEKHRKGTLGSPYSVKDYLAVNPEFGTLSEFKAFVEAAHKLGLYVIVDWVANHTAWDNNLVDQHPDWYARNWQGDYRPTPWSDWSDIIDLDYTQPELRDYMLSAMKYWVAEVGVDGYRCDVASFVPTSFWNHVRRELDAIKPVFMLAEAQERDLHYAAFDAGYAWDWYNTIHAVASGQADANALRAYYAAHQGAYPADTMRMMFTSNHDKNAWEGTQFEAFGDALPAAIALSVASEGIPLIYNGQEAGNNRRLKFFEKDPIRWQSHELASLFRRLFTLKKANRALWNAGWGAPMVQVVNSEPQSIFSFTRTKGDHRLLAMFNFSDQKRSFTLTDGPFANDWQDFASGQLLTLTGSSTVDLPAWGYQILVQPQTTSSP